MTFPLNSFQMSKTKGEIAFARNIGDNLVCTVDPSTGTPLVSAQAVYLISQSTGTADSPLLVAAAAPTDDIFGFVINTLRGQSFPASSQVDIAIKGAIMIMEASGAIAVGTRVGVTSTLQQIADASSMSITPIGILLDKAVNSGDLVRVLIESPLALTKAMVIAAE